MINNKTKNTVVVAMSGGVDSSVAAFLLKQEGYNCIGITMKLWDYENVGGNVNQESGCCSLNSINDARLVCSKIGIPHYVINFSKEFNETVIENFINEYIAGKTPNPCVQCNIKIKWESLIEKANELGADFIATGHYSRIEFDENSKSYGLFRGKDPKKDQSYALWGISQKNLAKTLFPLGNLTKTKVRKIAEEQGLKSAHKSESMEICFIPDNNYGRFLKNKVNGLEEKVTGGNLVDISGNKVGQHKGYPFFTIGQRRGIGTGFGKPTYVIATNPDKNEVVIGDEEHLYNKELVANSVNLINNININSGIKGQVKIRYNSTAKPARIEKYEDDKIHVIFDEPQKAITLGQSAVFYDGDKVLGGGIIESVIKNSN